jgi:transcriptional regulator with XRE-family HTH domain
MQKNDQAAREQFTALLAQLSQVRRRRGDLTQEIVAARLGVGTPAYSDWEAGRDDPTAVHFMEWSRVLGLRVAITDLDGNEISAAADTDAAHDELDDTHVQHALRRLSAVLRAQRAGRCLSQATLSATLGVNRRSITRWESARGYPRPIGFVSWARALKCNIRLVPAQTHEDLTVLRILAGQHQLPTARARAVSCREDQAPQEICTQP